MTLEYDGPQYQGKPTAYLDQNILDLFVDGKHEEFAEKLKSSFQIVYSDETLKEIQRSGDYAYKFLTVLRDLGAYHLKLVLEQPEFKETDRATLTHCDPFDAFQEYCENVKEYNYIQSSMEQWLFKYSGGLNGVGIAEIHENQKEAFSKLMNELRTQLQEFSDEIPDIECLSAEYENEMTANLAGALDETERLFKENIQDDKNWSGIKDLRNATGLGPKEFNNITPPGVIKKICEKYKNLPPYNAMDVGLEDFFGLKQNPIFPDRPHFKHQKVTGIYNMLNSIGYWPDSKVHKERRFVSALSDNSHASMASFCNVLLSRDEAFVKKVQAAYEYLEIPTVVRLVVVKNA
jgi:hypothetical protein